MHALKSDVVRNQCLNSKKTFTIERAVEQPIMLIFILGEFDFQELLWFQFTFFLLFKCNVFELIIVQLKKDMRLFYLALVTSILFLSCQKNTPDSPPFFNCDYNIQDSFVLVNKLIGSWKWIKTRSGGTGQIFQADTLRILTFRPDSTFSYFEGTTYPCEQLHLGCKFKSI